MSKLTVRALIIEAIKHFSFDDYCYERGDNNANKYTTYEAWLTSLDNEELLSAYRRVVNCDSG